MIKWEVPAEFWLLLLCVCVCVCRGVSDCVNCWIDSYASSVRKGKRWVKQKEIEVFRVCVCVCERERESECM